MYINYHAIVALLLSFLVGLYNGTLLSEEQLLHLPISQSPEEVQRALKHAAIIPDTLDDFVPSCYLHILYTSSLKLVRLGGRMKPSYTKDAPVVRIFCPNVTGIKDFTVALTDPDAPSRKDPKWSEMCHWIAVVPTIGDVLQDSRLDWDEEYKAPKEIIEYKPPGPPLKTGFHRYVFVLLAGDNNNLTAPSERKHWGTGKEKHGVRDWAEHEGLNVVGANFFYARNEEQ